jgi:hypothetical protein
VSVFVHSRAIPCSDPSRLLLVLCIVIVILVSFFIFYWNRFLGWLLGRGLRFLWWKRYNMWIECRMCSSTLILTGLINIISCYRIHSVRILSRSYSSKGRSVSLKQHVYPGASLSYHLALLALENTGGRGYSI